MCFLEWDQARESFESLLCDIMGTKPRTITCYSLIGMAVKFIYDANERTFLELGHPWEEMLEDFLPGRFRESIRLTHPEISRPDLLLKNFLRDLASFATDLTISEVCKDCKYTFHNKNILTHHQASHSQHMILLHVHCLFTLTLLRFPTQITIMFHNVA